MKFKLLAALGFVAATSLAQAQWYAVAAGGTTTADLGPLDVDVSSTGATATTYDTNGTSRGFKATVGYQLTPRLAMELGYVDLGNFNITANVSAPFVGTYRRDLSANGWTLMFAGNYPMGDTFSLLGKVGAIMSNAKSIRTATGAITVSGEPGSSHSEYNMAYGLGLQINLGKSWALRLEGETYVDLRPFQNNDLKRDYHLYSAGLLYKF